MTIKNVLLALALATFALAGCTQNTTFGIDANVLAFVDEADETGNLTVGDVDIDILGADGVALSDLGITENQAAGVNTLSLELLVDITATTGDSTIEASIQLAESSAGLAAGEIATGSVNVTQGNQETLSVSVDIDENDSANLATLRSGNAVIGVTLGISGGAGNEVTYTLQTIDLGGSYTPSEALSF